MPTKRRFTTAPFALGLVAGLAGWPTAQTAETAPPAAKPVESQPAQSAAPAQQEWLFATGEHWSKATDTERRAYILGILNMAMVEYQLTGPKPKHRTTVPRLVKALDGMTVPRLAEKVNAYYQANPDQQKRAVFEVIWFELVAPGTRTETSGAAKAK